MNIYNYYITRQDVLSEAIIEFYKDCYKFAQPSVEWDDFVQQNKDYVNNNEKGPKPYEFYYLPEKAYKYLQEVYIDSYRVKSDLHPHLELLISYFENPIRNKWIEKGSDLLSRDSGYRGYEHFNSLKEEIGEEAYSKVIEYINEAKNFYNIDYYYNSFLMTTALGATPSSNKEQVIKNWKKYRDKDIIIDESIYNEDEDWEGETE